MQPVKLKRGFVREDGMVFLTYRSAKGPGGLRVRREVWLPRDEFEKERARLSELSKAFQAKQMAANPEHVLARRKAYYQQNKAVQNERSRKWQRANRKKCLKWIADWRKKAVVRDPSIRLAHNARCRIYMALTGTAKATNTFALIGVADREEYKRLIESRMLPGMSWANYGEWDVDHIIPCRHFRPFDLEAQKVCFHHSNLQPLWKRVNVVKRGHVSPEAFDQVCGRAPADHVAYLRTLQAKLSAEGKLIEHSVLLEKLEGAARQHEDLVTASTEHAQ